MKENSTLRLSGSGVTPAAHQMQGSVVISCDLGAKFTRRYLIITGSTLWVSKQPILLEDKAHKAHLTGREDYLTIHMNPDSQISCPPSNHTSPALLHATATLVRDPHVPSSFTLNFMLPSERDKWFDALQAARQHLIAQRANGSYRRMLDLATRMHHAVPAMDRFYHLIRYRKCLLGSEAVLWLIHDQKCSQDEAVALGNQMIDMGLLHHVSYEHFLCHAYLFYRFDLLALAESDQFQLQRSSNTSSAAVCLVDQTKEKSLEEHNLQSEDEEDGEEDCVGVGQQGGREESMRLLHAVEDLEVENQELRARLQAHVAKEATRQFASSCQLADAVSTLENLEQQGVVCARCLAVLLTLRMLSIALLLVPIPPELWSWSVLVLAAHLAAAELYLQTLSRGLYMLLVLVLTRALGPDSCSAISLPSSRLGDRMKERDRELDRFENQDNEENDHHEQKVGGQHEVEVVCSEKNSIADINRDSIHKLYSESRLGNKLIGSEISSNGSDNGGSIQRSRGHEHNGTGDRETEISVTFPPPSEWPNYPLLVRRSPDMFRGNLTRFGTGARTRGAGGGGRPGSMDEDGEDRGPRDHVCSTDMRMLATIAVAGNSVDLIADIDGDTDSDTDTVSTREIRSSDSSSRCASLATLTQPVQIHQTPSEASVFPIDNHLFQGKVFVILAGLPDSPGDFFRNRNRLFEVVVQGRFKQRTPYSSVYNGQVFKKPFQTLPPKWMMRILLGLLSKIQPGLQVSLHGDKPYMVSSLIAASKNVVVSMPGTEPDIVITREGGLDAVKEDMRLLVGEAEGRKGSVKGVEQAANKVFASRSASKRAHYFSDLKHLDKFDYSPDHVYTFDFYQHVLNIGQMKLDLGFASLDVSSIIGFSPVQIMAVQWDPHNEPDLDAVNYFYNIEMWNQKSFPSDFFKE